MLDVIPKALLIAQDVLDKNDNCYAFKIARLALQPLLPTLQPWSAAERFANRLPKLPHLSKAMSMLSVHFLPPTDLLPNDVPKFIAAPLNHDWLPIFRAKTCWWNSFHLILFMIGYQSICRA